MAEEREHEPSHVVKVTVYRIAIAVTVLAALGFIVWSLIT